MNFTKNTPAAFTKSIKPIRLAFGKKGEYKTKDIHASMNFKEGERGRGKRRG